MALITRTDAGDLIPADVSREIIQGVSTSSAVLPLIKRLQDLTVGQRTMPVLNSLPVAYFVGATEGVPDKKKTTKLDWSHIELNAEELAVIVPIPQDVLDDINYDIWGEVKPRLVEAFDYLIDRTILYGGLLGFNKPTAWPDGVVKQATDKSHVIAHTDDLYTDLLEPNGVLDLIETDGFLPKAHIAVPQFKAMIRAVRDANGNPVFTKSTGGYGYELDGLPIIFPENGAIDSDESLLISGDWQVAVYAVRQDMTYTVLTEAVIQDPDTGAIVYNLAQQDMVALRAVIRLGWALPKIINKQNELNANAFPFAVLT